MTTERANGYRIAVLFACMLLVTVTLMVQTWQFERVEDAVLRNQQKLEQLEDSLKVQGDSLEALAARHAKRVQWLTRAIVSETNNKGEMEYLAWVIRNRVEAGWRGEDTYKGVILDPWQFSAFNRNSGKRSYFMEMTRETTPFKARWNQAQRVARKVLVADRSQAPFSASTTHFYSPVSMRGAAPSWAWKLREVKVASVNSQRFRFFDHES
jgi:hypothetical protein